MRTRHPTPIQISLAELRALRLRAQGLEPRRTRGALVDVVRGVCGVNAQLPSAMALSLRARVKGLTSQDIERSRVQDRSLVRTWCMRGTLHLLAAEDLEWLLATLAPTVRQAGWRWMERRGGLAQRQARAVLDSAYAILKRRGPCTRPELMAFLARRYGEAVKPAAAGIVHLNGLLGRVCFGPNRGAEPTYVALDNWMGRPVRAAGEPQLAELARRYLQGYGPAAPHDLAAWWGLSLTQASSAWSLIEQELLPLEVEGEPVWLLASQSRFLKEARRRTGEVRLLPAFDTYLLGYARREFAVPAPYQKRVFHGGELAPVVLLDGLAVGTWRYEQRNRVVRVRAAPFTSFTAAARAGLAREVTDIGRFWDLPAELELVKDI